MWFGTACLAAVLGAVEPDGSTPLLGASYRDDLDAATQLIRAGADVNAANDLGATPLWAACQNGSATMVRALLAAGANPNAALLKGETPLMMAARSGNPGVVEQLVSKGANPNARGPRGQTALMWAVSQKHPDVVRALLAHGADFRLRTETWKQMMAVPPHGHPEYNREIPFGSDTALLFAARVGDLASAKLLVAAGADVNDADAWGVTATVLAAHSDYREVVEFLLEKGADPNLAAAGFTALHNAIMHRDEQMVSALLARGANPNTPLRTWTPTRRSSRDFHFTPAMVGATPLWIAARLNEPGIIRLLVKRGADPHFVHRATYVLDSLERRTESATTLMAAMGMGGPAPDWRRQDGEDRQTRALETAKILVELGVDVQAANTDGRTALAAAKALHYDRVARFLAGSGAR
jgi:uncharacterized protein